MSNRAQRRAAERASRQTSNAAAPISEAQLNANRANAQMSTGPTSPAGKEISSHNAVKTGLTGRTILLPTDDVAAYQSIVAMVNAKFAPVNDIEKHLTQTIADTEWRLLRIPVLESGFYALGRHQLASECAHERDPQTRAVMLEALIFQTFQKDLRNLALQERRLRSQLKADTAELRRLRAERQEKEKEQEEAKPAATPQPATPNGFEFSTPEITPDSPTTPQAEITQETEMTTEATAAA
jgi:hypothetical protein